ncbi:NAD(P)H-hydrate dehydratase [Salegentibacter chungangensis]|uniref:Bifunctional NAD(P)H-hydrate repair enzyme n=1 Tax=Salegentibacter chungangensis TaxID=1335724 RepID=A0ABW3NTP3_9FLAO
MKIFSASQLQKADKISIDNQGITSEELMERAATRAFNEIENILDENKTVKLFCGIGNNGGDGLVIARLLKNSGHKAQVYAVNYSDKRSNDFLANNQKLEKMGLKPIVLKAEEDFPKISAEDIVIDAIFGIGLNRGIKGWPAKLVHHINHSGAFTIAIDMPSGLFSDQVPSENDAVIKADLCLTFQGPKLVFFLPQTMDYVNEFKVIDIGLDKQYLESLDSSYEITGRLEAAAIYKPRKKNTHKGNFGHTLIVGGSYGKIGSVILTAKTALKSGAGLCTLYIPKCGYIPAQTAIPEVMVLTDEGEEKLSEIEFDLEPDVICFGMGTGKDLVTKEAFGRLLERTKKPMLVDADGLNILSENKELLESVPKNSVLTPHPKELQRLIGEWKDDFDKVNKVKSFVKKYNLIIVLKGAYTFVFSGEKVFINISGNSGMATAGSGDVLSGVITALLSQGYSPENAARFGVYLHGKAGDLASADIGAEGMISGDIANYMGRAFKTLI